MQLQYIGARYVPIWYHNSVDDTANWEVNVQYEPLTWVTTPNDHLYLSKKTVPDNIGSPALNTEYWLDMGVFTASYPELKEMIGNLADLETTDKESLVAAINEIVGKIGDLTDLNTREQDNLVDAINEVITMIQGEVRKFILVSDSYGDPVQTGSTYTWLDRFEEYSGFECVKAYHEGYAFAPRYNPTVSLYKRLIMPGEVDTGVPADIDVESITDILVLGGFNDRASALADISNGINQFCIYARQTYPNLKNIYIGGVGWTMMYDLPGMDRGKYLCAYTQCGEFGAKYLNGIENVLHDFDLFNPQTDRYVHPNNAGGIELAKAALAGIMTGYVDVHKEWKTFTLTANNGVGIGSGLASTFTVKECQDGDTVYLEFPTLPLYKQWFSIGSGVTRIMFSTIDEGYYNAGQEIRIPCYGFVARGGYAQNTDMNMQLIMSGGNLYVELQGNFVDNSTKTCEVIYIYPTTITCNVRNA